jgi:hypothetical protein
LLAAREYDLPPLRLLSLALLIRLATRPMVSPKKGSLCDWYRDWLGKPCTMLIPPTRRDWMMAPRGRKVMGADDDIVGVVDYLRG